MREGRKEGTNERIYTTTKHITTLLLRSRVKTQCIFNSDFSLYIYPPKKYKIQSKNIIMCCEFDAKMHLDT